MVSKFHGVIATLSIVALVSNLLWLPSAINANYALVTGSANGNQPQLDLAALANPLTLTSFQSGILRCTFFENVYADYTDGTYQIVGTNYNYQANPIIAASLVNPSAPTKTISDFDVVIGNLCNVNSPTIVSSNVMSGNLKVYAQVSGSDGQQHILIGGTNINVPSQAITSGNFVKLYSYRLLPSQIQQYNNLQGTNQFTLKVYVQPTLNYVTTFTSDSALPPQNSVYSGWVTQLFTGNTVNNPTPTTSTTFAPQPTSSLPQCTSSTTQSCIPTSPSACPSGTVYSSTYLICLATNVVQSSPTVTAPKTIATGTTIATANVRFFYSLLFKGDPSQYCGTAIPAPATGCVVAPTSGPLTINLSSLNIIGTTRGTINSLQTFNVEPIMTPSVKGLNINPSTSIVYTGALTIDGKTIAIPSSGITSDNKAFMDSNGDFRFPTASIDPVTIDTILKQNGIQPTTPDNLVIRIFATGKFTGTSPTGQFQGVLNGPYIDISVWYVSNTSPLFTAASGTPTTSPTGQNNPNCNFGTNPDGSCIPTPAPPATNCPAGQQAVITGQTTYTCIAPTPNNTPTPPSTPPTTPPNPCVDMSSGGICNDPQPNPTTPPPSGTSSGSPSGGPVMFPPPDGTPTAGNPPTPSGTCTGADCLTNFNTSTNATPQFDTTAQIGIIVFIIAIISIIAVVINKKRNH